jgi:hypothetical protein
MTNWLYQYKRSNEHKIGMPGEKRRDQTFDFAQCRQRRGLVSVTTMRKVPGKLLLTVCAISRMR